MTRLEFISGGHFKKTRNELPFKIVAICLLPDHLHMIWQLPDHDDDYSTRAKMLKASFTESWLAVGGWEGNVNASRKTKGERGVWQRRFWEHTIRNEADLENCVHYIHWNPRKHGLVTQVVDYPYSSFHRYVYEGHYDAGWGGSDPCGDWPEAEFVRE